MCMRTRADERMELATAALRALLATLEDGEHKYPVDYWRGVSRADHMAHARIHFANAEADNNEKDWAHGITRVLMAWLTGSSDC